jgi:hypothetical protein
MGDLVVVAPVLPTRESALRTYLRELDPSPLVQLPCATHFARFVVVPLDGPRLLFSSRFDVSVARYIEALAKLPYILAAWADVSVGEVNEALELRSRLSGLVVEAEELGAVGLAHAFRERFPR